MDTAVHDQLLLHGGCSQAVHQHGYLIPLCQRHILGDPVHQGFGHLIRGHHLSHFNAFFPVDPHSDLNLIIPDLKGGLAYLWHNTG